ncbi:MAG: hypothetical protein ACM3QZ_11620 [Solirubrobacterales bacterium]
MKENNVPTILTVQENGWVQLDRKTRVALEIEEGTKLAVASASNGILTLKPIPKTMQWKTWDEYWKAVDDSWRDVLRGNHMREKEPPDDPSANHL